MAAPVIKEPFFAYGQVGLSFGYKIRAFGQVDVFGYVGVLPGGLTFDAARGEIGGAPTSAGNFTVIINASNSSGTGSASLAIHINASGVPYVAPFFSDAIMGQPFSQAIAASNTPTAFTMPVVPPGLTFNTSTGVLSGTPTTESQTTSYTITMTNVTGTGESAWSIRVLSFPSITSGLELDGQVGELLRYQITVVGHADVFNIDPIADGMTFDLRSGAMTWTPTEPGMFFFELAAANTAGTDTKTLAINVAPISGGGGGGGGGGGTYTGGIRFIDAKNSLRTVVDNGVDVEDARVIRRTNEATQELLAVMIPVNGMASYVVQTDSRGFFLLPETLENVIECFPYEDGVKVYGEGDRPGYFYDLVSPFTYLDASIAHSNPLIDHYLVQDPTRPNVLRRSYEYPGLTPEAFVSITGAKNYLPLKFDEDYLIIQNVPALKLMIQAIERRENNDPDGSMKYKSMAVELLTEEVKKHQMDPANVMRRKAEWENDLYKYGMYSMGWLRARIALEVPGAMGKGREDLTRLLERAELRLMEMGIWKSSVEEIDATITGGRVYFPARVESVLAADVCGMPIPIRSIFYKYLENGPGDWDCTCGGRIEDDGEEILPNNVTRRRYRVLIGDDQTQTLRAICKLRWVPHIATDLMIIRNLEAMRLMATAIIEEQAGRWAEANMAEAKAKAVLDQELKEYLAGVKFTPPIVNDGTWDMAGLGQPL